MQIRQDSIIASPSLNASFNFSLSGHSMPRQQVVPARFYFTATDSEHLYNLSTGANAYPAWESNYTTNSWGTPTAINSPGYNLFTQILQIASDSTTGLATNSLAVARLSLAGSVDFATYADADSLLASPNYTKTGISTTSPPKPIAMMQSKAHIYLFWLDVDKIRCTTKNSGNGFDVISTLATPQLNTARGLDGCTITSGAQEYVALTYTTSDDTINIATFLNGSTTAVGSQTITLKDEFGASISIAPTKVAISFNKRTEKVTLQWVVTSGKGYFSTYSFSPPAGFTEIAGPTLIDTGFKISLSASVESYANCENTLVLPAAASILSYSLREPDVLSTHGDFGAFGELVEFPFRYKDKYYAGLVQYRYADYSFYRRELKFPDAGRWNKTSKTLHLQGPPQLNTQVTIEYEFAEVATSSCLAHVVNANGGRMPFNNKTGVIISKAINIFTIKFDASMDKTLYSNAFTTNKITMLASNSSNIALVYLPAESTNTDMSFRTDTDLLFNNAYSILIASDVIDARGTQIWEPVTLNFTTQQTSSSVIASEVKNITAWRDPARTQQISSPNEASDTADIYLRLEAFDPAFNTIDTATAVVFLNGAQIAQTTLTQLSPASSYFDGYYQLVAPLASDSVYRFKGHPDSATAASVIVTYPTFSSIYPAAGATGIPGLPTIRINCSESILPTDISATTVKLLKGAVEITANRSYNDGTKEISLTPTAILESETVYTVTVAGLRDTYYNTQKSAFSSQFTVADIKPPEVTTFSPNTGETGVTIDRHVFVNFSEALLAGTLSKTSVKLTRGGNAASYSIILSGNKITIDPDDAPDGGFRPQTTYALQITTAVTDLAGNNLQAAFNLSFTTQPYSTPPSGIANITLYKDPLLITGWGLYEKIPASATVYLKVKGDDGATQTRDLATATLNFSWGAPATKISLQETASNSTGIYLGSFDFGAIPLYGLPAPLPPASIGSLTFSVDIAPANAATLTVAFPALISGETLVNNTAGQVIAVNATNVRIDSPLTLSFSEQLADAGSLISLAISSGTTVIAGTRTLSADRHKITFQADSDLPYSSKITVKADYAANGLKSLQGNPLYRPVNFAFTTQASQTQPGSISQISLFPDASYSTINAYASNDDFPRSGNMYIEARGPDNSPNTVDFTMVNISTGDSLRLDETGANSGIYRGIYNYSSLTDGFTFIVSSAVTPAASQTLILTIPTLTPQTPASGSINVSIATNIIVKASEALDTTTVNNANFKLYNSGSEIAGTVNYNSIDREITFTPTATLATSTLYIYRVNNCQDLAGNSISSSLNVSFTTQGATIPPTPPIVHLKVYADSAYTSELPDLSQVNPGSRVYVEVQVALDASPATIDSALVEQSSDLTPATVTATLIETGVNTSVFRGSLTVFNQESATITIISLTEPSLVDPAKYKRLQTRTNPKINSLAPATDNIVYLNQTFTITTSKDVAAASLSTSSVRLADALGAASYTLTLPTPRTIKINSDLQPGCTVVLRLTPDLKDTDGMEFPDRVANYTSISQSFSTFGLYSDAGLANLLANNAEVEVGQTIYLRLDGSDTRSGEIETATATLKSSLPDADITLSENAAGRFTGSFTAPDLADETIEIVPENRTDLTRKLKILPIFALLSYSPASGAITVPSDSWPTWNFNRSVRNSDLTAVNFSLKKASNGSLVPGMLTTSLSGQQVRFQPAGLLALLTEYEMSVSAAVKDTAGNTLGASLKTRFSTQPPPAPPSENIRLANYETASYATKTMAVANNDSLYLELVAKDTSFSTYETARVRVESSDGSMDGLELTLVEMAPPSGVYRLRLPINLAAGTTIKIQSQGDSTAIITVTARVRTNLLAITPASGSAGLFLDNPLKLTFSHGMDRNTAATGLQLLASSASNIDLSFAYTDSDRTIIITPIISYASSTRHQLQMLTNLRDSNGLFLLPDTAWFTTRSESSATIDLLTGIPPRDGQSVTLNGEATPGPLVILATTTNMLETFSETRALQLDTASGSDMITLNEIAPGSFRGEYNLPADTVGNITATLLFSSQPKLTFQLAPLPEVVSAIPASGSSDIAELPVISATFTRKLAYESTSDALRIVTDLGNIITSRTSPAVDSTGFSWRPLSPLPLQSTCTLQLSGIKDYLGQDLAPYSHQFVTSGRQGISLFSDNGFAQLLATDQIDIPVVFVEIAASGTLNLSGRVFDMHARSGTQASTTVKLQLEAFNTESGRFRCSLELEPGKAVPQYQLSLLPGEWLELTAPVLTDDRRLVYYKQSGTASPLSILGIKLYSEKHFAQRVIDTIANPTLFIEVEAEDLNWFTTDTTRVKISSEADPAGIFLDLIENGTHSSQFRNFVRLSRDISDPAVNNLKVMPAQRIYIESATDPAVKTMILYLPENTIKMMAVYPSPARGNSVNFRFYLNFPTYVALKIYDTAGDEVFSTGIRGVEGENLYEWRIPPKIANGVYFYRVKIDNESGFPDAKRRVRGKFAILR